jgi:soluble lytic murein transglycosylase-like protein
MNELRRIRERVARCGLDWNRLMQIRLFAVAAALVTSQAAFAQAPSQSAPDTATKNEPATLESSRPAKQKFAPGRRADYEAMVAQHAKANDVPESLVHRIIVRESKYQPHVVSKGNIGLMQIKLATARGLGYTGTAEGLRDANTNMTYAVKYLAGAWRTANGNADQAVSYYARGYYYAAKKKGSAMQVVSLRDTGRRKGKSFMPAVARLDELTEAKAQVGSAD